MLNIFADALLIAARLGRLPADDLRADSTNRGPERFPDIESFRVGDTRHKQDR